MNATVRFFAFVRYLIMTQNNFQIRHGLKRAKIFLLPSGQVKIVGAIGHVSRKVFDSVDLILGQKKLAEFGNIQPFVGSALQGAVIEIESVECNVMPQ